MAQNHIHLYKILDEAPQEPMPSTLPTTDLDAKDGFIHLSTARQIPTTANLFFGHCTKLWLLKLRASDLDGELRFPAELPGCAHLHNSRAGLGKGNISAVVEAPRAHHQDWTTVPEMTTLED